MLPREPPLNIHIGLLSPIGLSSRRGRLRTGQRDTDVLRNHHGLFYLHPLFQL